MTANPTGTPPPSASPRVPGAAAGRVAILPAGRPEGVVALLGPAGPDRNSLLREAAPAPDRVVAAATDTLFPRLGVAGNVAFALRARGLGRGERNRVSAELLALCGLERDGSRPIGSLHATERALLLLARAAATGRRALLLDDPARGLDGAGRERVFTAIRRLARLDRAAIVLATADRTDALAVADRIAVMSGGAVIAVDTPDTLAARPGSAAVAHAIADSNVLPGRVRQEVDDRDDALVTLSTGHDMPARLAPDTDPGALCLLAVAPQRIAFASVPAERMGAGAIPATLVDHRRGEAHLRLRLRLEDGTTVVVHRPTGSLSARDAAAASETLGASLAWRAGDATAFPHPDA